MPEGRLRITIYPDHSMIHDLKQPVVAFDAQSLTGAGQTGLGVYARGIARAVQRHSDEVCIKLIWPKNRKPFRRTLERLIWGEAHLPSGARKEGASVIHVPCFSAPRFTKIPVVVTAHDLIVLKHPHLMPPGSRWYFASWIPGSYKSADRIIAVSECTKNDLVDFLDIPEEKITVIHHGVDSIYSSGRDRQDVSVVREKYQVDGEFFLMVGSFEPRKNVDRAIDAFAAIKDMPDTLKLVLVGKDSPHKGKMIEKASGLGLSERISFPGYIPDSDISALLSICTSFVFPSSAEGFGLPLLEAMNSGAPVIASDLKVFREIAGDAAWYVPVGDTEALSASMRKMLDDAEFRSALIRSGLERAKSFDCETAAMKTIEVYKSVV